jgi:hypothetical protein
LSFEEHLARVVPDENGCWPWPGFVNQSRYGVTGRHTNAHVRSYEYFIGPVPEGHDVGHLCHDQDLSCQDWRICTHRQCVNPAHLKPMTRSDNLTSRPWRKQFCIRGHELSPENVYIIKQTGGRQCVPCKRMLVAAKREKINARKRELAAMKRAVVLLPTQRVATDSPISEQLHLSL